MISNRNNFSYLRCTSHPHTSFQVPSQLAFLVQEKKRKIEFQFGRHGGHPGFPIRMILATFDLKATLMIPTKLQIKWSFGSGEEAKNRFSRRPSWIYDRNDFSYFSSTSHPDASYQVSSQLAFWFSRRSEK